jgi:signal peptidase II
MLGVALDLWSKDWAFRHVAGFAVAIQRDDVIRMSPGRLDALLPPHEPVPIVGRETGRFLEFKLVLNPGAVFGIGAGKRYFFVVFTALAMVFGLYMFAAWTRPRDRWAHAAIGLVISGGIGNLYDRIQYACVRDFISPLPGFDLPFGLHWPGGEARVWPWVSNVADLFLIIGVVVLILHTLRVGAKPAETTPDASA